MTSLCADCGHANVDAARFCVECGTALTRRCVSCRGELPPHAKFCAECGARVAMVAVALARDPRSYTPKHLADKILKSKSALEGER